MLHYVLLIARCGKRRKTRELVKGRSSYHCDGLTETHTRSERETGKWGDMAYCEHTKSYFHQFTEVEINMTVAYLFQ